MNQITIWARIGAVGVLLAGAALTGCTNQNSAPDKTSTATAPPATNAGNAKSAPQTDTNGGRMSDDTMPGRGTGEKMSGMGKNMGKNMGGMDGSSNPKKHMDSNGKSMPGNGMHGGG